MVVRVEQVAREMRTELPMPVLHVDTNDDYEPRLDAMIAFATGRGLSA